MRTIIPNQNVLLFKEILYLGDDFEKEYKISVIITMVHYSGEDLDRVQGVKSLGHFFEKIGVIQFRICLRPVKSARNYFRPPDLPFRHT